MADVQINEVGTQGDTIISTDDRSSMTKSDPEANSSKGAITYFVYFVVALCLLGVGIGIGFAAGSSGSADNDQTAAETLAASQSCSRQADAPALAEIDYAIDGDWMTAHGYGPTDKIGAINRITVDKVLAAKALVQQGKSYPLAVETGPATPAFGDRFFRMNAYEVDLGTVQYNEDETVGSVGVGTHIDGLGHIAIGGVYYNGVDLDSEAKFGINELSAANMPPIVTRAVVLDMPKYYDVDRMEWNQVIYPADLVGAARNQNVCFGEGDVLIIYTGFMQVWLEDGDGDTFKSSGPGIGVEASQYLADLGVVAVASDTWAVEVLPGEGDASRTGEDEFKVNVTLFMPHQILIPKMGVYIIENVNAKEFLDDGHSEGLIIITAARFQGSVQTNVNPIIMV